MSSNVTIDRTSVHSGYITLAEGAFDATGTLTFTFEDAYWSYKNGFGWSDEKGYGATTYYVSCKVADLISGTTLNFQTDGFTLPGKNTVSVQLDYNRPPYTLFNFNKIDNVNVSCDIDGNGVAEDICTISISCSRSGSYGNYTYNFNISSEEIFIPISDTGKIVTFTFVDTYRGYSSWETLTTYTAKKTVQELINGTNLEFSHP